ncbi:MAG: GNAT family N-acetyltransferase [Proteobacteria bacterium]|nr:GNAT family N-acetyltransferase [Pseudomonadota bacterium]
MKCEIIWDKDAAEEVFRLCPRSNLLQSSVYGDVFCALNGMRARRGVVTRGGRRAGCVQILESGALGNLLHAVILDRGPLWLPGFGSADDAAAFFSAFNEALPPRIGRRRRIIPEIPDGDPARNALLRSGLKRLGRPGYQTLWLDLRADIDVILKTLSSSWRNKVRKGEKSGLEIIWETKNAEIARLLRIYQRDKGKKGYEGPSLRLAAALAEKFHQQDSFLAGQARMDGVTVAAVLIFRHGTSATYQIGWTTENGKKQAAHNLLLWQACVTLKEKGIDYFDLGGVNDETAYGVKKFKEGMGGALVTLAGHYI